MQTGMPVARSDQKSLDELKRLRAALDGEGPLMDEEQEEYVRSCGRILGEDPEKMLETANSDIAEAGPVTTVDLKKRIQEVLAALQIRVDEHRRETPLVSQTTRQSGQLEAHVRSFEHLEEKVDSLNEAITRGYVSGVELMLSLIHI